jgi:hypothetical protein
MSFIDLEREIAARHVREAEERVERQKALLESLDDPSLPPVLVLLPFPRIVPGNGSFIAFGPAHHNRISFTWGAA